MQSSLHGMIDKAHRYAEEPERVHLARLGHPIAGDVAYGSRTDPFGRLALHAHVLGFEHPGTAARMRFVSPAPAAFAKLPA